MPYCRKCGAEIPEGAAYCQRCGTPVEPVARRELAGWGERSVAWLIDMIVVGIFLAPIRWFLTWRVWPWELWIPRFLRWVPFVDLGLNSFVFFLYWTLMEGTYGQSVGKMAMRIRVTRLNGGTIDLIRAAIESLGKAFLLPLDCLIGWILYPDRRQRLFNYISETIILKTPSR